VWESNDSLDGPSAAGGVHRLRIAVGGEGCSVKSMQVG
jgi:hypothetical protein